MTDRERARDRDALEAERDRHETGPEGEPIRDAEDPDVQATLPEEQAFGEVHPDATAETYAAQSRPQAGDRGAYPGSAGRAEEAPGDEAQRRHRRRGSALPSEEGRRD